MSLLDGRALHMMQLSWVMPLIGEMGSLFHKVFALMTTNNEHFLSATHGTQSHSRHVIVGKYYLIDVVCCILLMSPIKTSNSFMPNVFYPGLAVFDVSMVSICCMHFILVV
jgi:hypothetical protein